MLRNRRRERTRFFDADVFGEIAEIADAIVTMSAVGAERDHGAALDDNEGITFLAVGRRERAREFDAHAVEDLARAPL